MDWGERGSGCGGERDAESEDKGESVTIAPPFDLSGGEDALSFRAGVWMG